MGQDNSKIQDKQLLSINREVLCVAAAAAQMSNLELLRKLGIDESCVDPLRGVTVRALERMREFPISLVDVSVNTKALNYLLDYLRNEQLSETIVDRAIRLGLRQPMLKTLTGMTRREYEQRKAMMGLPAQERGRIESLSEEDELRVLRAWETALQSPELSTDLERLCFVSESTSLSADRVWNTVMEGI